MTVQHPCKCISVLTCHYWVNTIKPHFNVQCAVVGSNLRETFEAANCIGPHHRVLVGVVE